MNGRRLLLVSSSVVHGTGYLDHCEEQTLDLFAGAGRVLFVPWALYDRAGYAATVRERFAAWEREVDSLHDATDPVAAVRDAQGIFIGGGNTFRLLRELQRSDVMEAIRQRVADGMPYMGTSAGSNVAGATIRTTNDMPIVETAGFDALGLVPFQINPHYVDPDPDSTHQGETRDQRLFEFHEENATPVVAIREGAMIEVKDGETNLRGATGGKLFLPGREPRELSGGERLAPLLNP